MKMKLRGIKDLFFLLLPVLLVSCTGLFDLANEDIEDFSPPAMIYFNNLNCFIVDVYSDHNRTGDKYTIPALEMYPPPGSEITWSKAEDGGFWFYFTYYLPVGDNNIPYIPPYGSIAYSTNYIIIQTENNKIDIPVLDELIDEDEQLFTDFFFSIKNNTSRAVQLLSGTSVKKQINGNENISQAGQANSTGLYQLSLNERNSNFKLQVIPEEISLPLPDFQSGYLYEIELNAAGNSATLKSEKLITLGMFINTN